jgi:hypothetical protein
MALTDGKQLQGSADWENQRISIFDSYLFNHCFTDYADLQLIACVCPA